MKMAIAIVSKVDPIQHEVGLAKALKKVVMIEPDNSHGNEGEPISEIRRPFLQQILCQSAPWRVGSMYFEDQEGDDDREGTVTERFQSRRIAKLQLISLFRRANRIF
jgi:hypothetical protein